MMTLARSFLIALILTLALALRPGPLAHAQSTTEDDVWIDWSEEETLPPTAEPTDSAPEQETTSPDLSQTMDTFGTVDGDWFEQSATAPITSPAPVDLLSAPAATSSLQASSGPPEAAAPTAPRGEVVDDTGEPMFWSDEEISASPAVSPVATAQASADSPQSNNAVNYFADQQMSFADPAPSFATAVAASDIEVTFEAITISPILNVTAGNDPKVVIGGDKVHFTAQWNYSPWIKFGEVRVFKAHHTYYDTPVAILPVGDNFQATWTTEEFGDYFYVLRVYDGEGHFDETIPKSIRVVTSATATALKALENEDYDPLKQIYDVDHTRARNIPLYGGMVTVHGSNVPSGQSIRVFGRDIPVTDEGEFVAQEIMPPGTHDLSIEYLEDEEIVRQLMRDVTIGDAQWSYVFLGDLVVGENLEAGPANLSNNQDPEFDDIYVNGRAAFYVNGRFKQKYKLTARVDTGYEAVDDIARNIDEKDPQYLFRRLDPGETYPVYADESTSVNMTPSQGKIYARIENGDSYFLWGNYATGIQDTDFAQIERGLYGAKVNLVGVDTTRFGERRYRFQGFAAEPGTLPSREEFRGTGGSSYLLGHQDISIGTERVRIEVRDRETRLPKETYDLNHREDYDIDYIQGRILLNRPLSSYAENQHYVRTGSVSGDQVYLIVDYEYTPTISDFEGWSVGGRASAWLNDYLRVGITGYNENTDGRDQRQYSADIIFRRSPQTYIHGDFVRTLGTGFGASGSSDGGFSFDDLAAGLTPDSAKGWRVEGGLDGVDIGLEQDRLRLTGFYEHRDPYLSVLGRYTPEDTDQWGANLLTMLSDTTEVRSSYSEAEISNAMVSRDITVDVKQELGLGFNLGLGYRETHRVRTTLLGTSLQERQDGAIQLEYDPDRLWSGYVFGQTTMNKTDDLVIDNERLGVGAKVRIAERFDMGAEISSGDGGLGAQIKSNYRTHEGSEVYLGYQVDPDRTDTGTSDIGPFGISNEILTVGSRIRYSDNMSIFGEERYQSGDNSVGLTHTYGIEFNPSENWRIAGSIESGEIDFDDGRVIDRDALSVSVGYDNDIYTLVSNFEAREDATATETRDTYLSRTMFDVTGYENWRFMGRFNWMNSRSSRGEFYDGEFMDATIGYGYRPVEHDRVNFLLKYTYFMDLPGAEQITPSGLTADYKQKSQIFVSDLNYDVTERLTLGLKYGIRVGEITTSRTTDDFFDSVAQLGVVRIDWHFVRKWDFLAEQRILHTDVGDMTESGSLIALYRHLGNHIKFGVGYNFADFSDQLTNVSYDDEGYFLNLVTKY